MPQDYRPTNDRRGREQSHSRESDFGRRGWMRSGEDARRDRSSWGERPFEPERGFASERSYPGRYPPARGYRGDYWKDRLAQERRELREGRLGDLERSHWDKDVEDQDYYGVGSHYGAGYGTAPSSRASGAGSWGDAGYDESDDWSERDDWLPDSSRVTSGSYGGYGRSAYGAQSAYGRTYGRSVGADYGAHYRDPRSTGDSPYAQSFRGRGPKGYERSDERLKEIVCERLTDDPHIDASDVSVEVAQKIVRLTGWVEDRQTKYAIEDLIERCGVQDIDNQVRVRSGRQPPLLGEVRSASSPSARRT
jgi:BON domain